MRIDRRGLLIGGGIGVGLLVAWQVWPDDENALAIPDDGVAIGGLLTLSPDGTIALHSPQVETGQGIWTALAQLVADELGARFDDVAVQPLQAGAGFDNPIIDRTFGADLRLTGAATSVRGFALSVRRAAAAMRVMLVTEASDRTDLSKDALTVIDSEVLGGPRPLSFASLAEGAARRGKPFDPPLRPWAGGEIVGTAARRVDTVPKARGNWRFASDVRLPEMLHASARLAPQGYKTTKLDRAAATGRPGISDLIEEKAFVAVVGESWWAAEQALRAARVRFLTPPVDHARVERALADAMANGRARSLFDVGDAKEVLEGAEAPVDATYGAAALAHHGLDPLSATARPRSDGGIDLWAGTRAPDATRAAAAAAVGLPPAAVRLIPMGVGEDTGRTLENDAAAIAARLAMQIGKPVQLTLPADQARLLGPVRSPFAARMRARLGGGRIVALHARYAGLPGMGSSLERLGALRSARFGKNSLPYAIGDQRIEAVTADLALRTGWHRTGEAALHVFASESLIDEASRALGIEPFSFRIGMLAGDVRLAQLLARAADAAGWDGGGTGSNMGIACAALDGSRIALIVEAGLSGDRIAVERMVAAVDCGAMVNPGLVEQQVAGGLLSALEDATGIAPSIEDGLIRQRGTVPRASLRDLPDIDVLTTPSDQMPGGVTSLGPAVLAPALANALAADQGPRLRRLPFSLDDA